MTSAAKAKTTAALLTLLEGCESTADFLICVQSAIEQLYADETADTCPEGFAALDSAIDAFSLERT